MLCGVKQVERSGNTAAAAANISCALSRPALNRRVHYTIVRSKYNLALNRTPDPSSTTDRNGEQKTEEREREIHNLIHAHAHTHTYALKIKKSNKDGVRFAR